MNTKLHLYIEMNENETAEQAINRTNETIEILFSEYGFTVLEQFKDDDGNENEIKSYLSVDISKEQAHKILNDYMYQVY